MSKEKKYEDPVIDKGEDDIKNWREECERLAGLVEFWQKKYYELNPGFQLPKIDNL